MWRQWTSRVLAVSLVVLTTTACGTVLSQGRGYPNYPNYPNGPRGGGPRGGYVDVAYERGFDDGYERGYDAARDRDRYDPRRERWYRSADRGYNGRYGSRSEYKQIYRDGFVRGYDLGYRDGRYRR